MNTREQAIALLAKGIETAKAGDSPMAYRMMSSAAAVDPTYAEAWYSLGNANSDMAQTAGSIACHRRCVELDPKNSFAWTNLGWQLYHNGRFAEARTAIDHALALKPDNAFALCNLAMIDSVEGNLSMALRHAEHAYDIDPNTPEVQANLGFTYFFNRDWANGLYHYKARFAYKMKHFLNFPYPEWQGESMLSADDAASNVTLFLTTDMGIGDTLSMLRFVPLAAARVTNVILQVNPELMRLAAAMLLPYKNVRIGPIGSMFPEADYWSTLTCLPVALGLTNEQIEATGNLKVPNLPLAPTQPWKVPGRKLHVGIAWAGSPENGIDKWRSMPFEPFLDLCRVPGVQLYSLQVGPHAEDLHTSGCIALVKDLAPMVRDVADTGAIMRDLDIVITVESAVGHIAGCHDVDCFIPYSYAGRDWRAGHDGTKPLWYKRHKFFKQGPDMQWQPVIDRMTDALRERVS